MKEDIHFSDRNQCDFRLSKEQYFYYFAADLFLFYLAPLGIALVIYTRIVSILYKSVQNFKRDHGGIDRALSNELQPTLVSPCETEIPQHLPINKTTSLLAYTESAANEEQQRLNSVHHRMQSRAHVSGKRRQIKHPNTNGITLHWRPRV